MQALEKILEEIKAHRNFASECGNFNVASAFELCVEIIRKHMNDGWVSVEERLPEYGKKVLVYGKSGEIDIASLYSRDKHMWLVGSMCSVAFDITAWRPMPEPYHPERRDAVERE